jgi:alpha-glucosidase
MKQLAILLAVSLFLISNTTTYAKEYELKSPDKKIIVNINVGDEITYSISQNGTSLLKNCQLSLTTEKHGILGKKSRLKKGKTTTTNQTHHPVVRQKSKEIKDHYNQLVLIFKEKFSIEFRAYNEGVAYRFVTRQKKDLRIIRENGTYNFPEGYHVYFPEESKMFSHNEREYLYLPVKDIEKTRFCSLPALIKATNGTNILITESNLRDYPGMWLQGTGGNGFKAIFQAYPKQAMQTSDRDVEVNECEYYFADTEGSRTFPWRILAISEDDAGLVTNQLSWLLASENRIEDPSWIKPGKVAWDWWNYNNIYGVDFRAGINNDTYKYYIDFASQYGIDYVILDEGWYELGDLLDVNPDIDVQELVDYGKKKDVGIILWVVWKTLDDQLEEALEQFEKWGVVGLKVDFMQRDDQWMVQYYWKIAREAAKRKMLVDFHGSYKPSGLRRTYPNVLTREGVRGLEWNKWSDVITPDHDLTIPFIRMVAGPMDYTPGAMVNAQKDNFHAIFSRPMSQGTRCHQLAMYVIYESPLQMLADNPSNYQRETECMEFLTVVPVQWDKTMVIEAKVGDYLVMARENGGEWYIGAMTDWTEREFEILLDFLEEGTYNIDIWQDGVNADRYASDYKKLSGEVSKGETLKLTMAPGGGYVARIYRK